MNCMSYTLCAVLVVGFCSSTDAAVKPLERPSMAVVVEAGDYAVRGQVVKVASTVELQIAPREAVHVSAEEHIISDITAQNWGGGTSLNKVLGPVDTGTRLPHALDPASVVVYAKPGPLGVYTDKDYYLDRIWGGISRIDGGAIGQDTKVLIDYTVYQQRIDTVQVSKAGAVSIKKGVPAAVCAPISEPDPGCTALAHIYVSYQTSAIRSDDIYLLPVRNIDWQEFIKTSGKQHLTRTLELLKSKKHIAVVCWGDSVTCGGSSSSPETSYVELFRSRLMAAYPKCEIKLINAGIGGSNTVSRHDGYDNEVLSHNPDLITVEFVNDAGLETDMIKKNWAEFVERARQKNPDVEFILITPHNMLPDWMVSFSDRVNVMRQASIDNQVALADANNVWLNLNKVGIPYYSLLANGINHPNDFGHEIFASTLMQLLKPAL